MVADPGPAGGPEEPATYVGDEVEVTVPARSGYIALLRSAAATLAARVDFTVDEIDDLRIAVDEACALLLPDARPATELCCRFTVAADSVHITVRAATEHARTPERTSFPWMVLTALAGDVTVDTGSDREVTIGLRKQRGTSR